MKSFPATALAAAIATACALAPLAARSAPADEAQIKALEDKFAAAFNAVCRLRGFGHEADEAGTGRNRHQPPADDAAFVGWNS